MATKMLYRSKQFFLALRSRPLTEDELAPARGVLTPQQMELFTRLQPGEQIHALRVLKTLQGQGETHPDLLTAALLHDVGKCRVPLHLWERVFIVIGKKLFPRRVQFWGQGSPRGWRRPFVVAAGHPSWGAELALGVGTSPLALQLIRQHQNDLPPAGNPLERRLLDTLKQADNQN